MPEEKRVKKGWRVLWIPENEKFVGYVQVSNGSLTTEALGRVALDARAYDTAELCQEMIRVTTDLLTTKEMWEY